MYHNVYVLKINACSMVCINSAECWRLQQPVADVWVEVVVVQSSPDTPDFGGAVQADNNKTSTNIHTW